MEMSRLCLFETKSRLLLDGAIMRPCFLPPTSLSHLHRRIPPVETRRTVIAQQRQNMSISEHITNLRLLRPRLKPASHKGQSGRIAIIGGSELYTGAPYFASQSALLGGADLSYVYTAVSAAPAIKSYSPDLIVHPGFEHLGNELEALQRMHAVVIGPGLGREGYAKDLVRRVLAWDGVVVLDADALWFLQEEDVRSCLVREKNSVRVLTPNKIEAIRLLNSAKCDSVHAFTKTYPNVIVLEKGEVDRIICDKGVIEVAAPASQKRAGGQGDVLAGILAAFCGWCTTKEQVLSATVGASLVTRAAGRMAFDDVGRALVARDLLRFVGSAVEEVLDVEDG